MNTDENNPEKQTPAETELEACIVAWVSGEASAFEVAELERLVREKPELAIFKRRMEAVRGLVAEAVAPDTEPMRLSPEARAKLLQAIGVPEKAAAPGAPEVPSLAIAIQRHRKQQRWMLAAAACLVCGLFLSMMIPSFQRVRPMAEEKRSSREIAQQPANELELPVAPVEIDEKLPASAPALGEMPVVAAAPTRVFGAPRSVIADSRVDNAGSLKVATQQFLQDADATRPQDNLRISVNAGAVNSREEVAAEEGGQGTGQAANAAGGSANQQAGVAANDTAAFGAPGDAVLAKQQNAPQQQASADRPPADADGEAANLSAFVVAPGQDKGTVPYGADSTLAGTRVRTGVDAPAPPVSYVTDQVPEDAAKKDSKSLLKAGAIDEAGLSGESNAAKEPVSTFSLHVSDVSFRLAQMALARGMAPDAGRIRPEEFYNAFDYGDPAPAMSEKVSCRIEQAADPVKQQRNLVRIAMRVPATGHGAGQPLRLTVLLDTSGSMEREDRAAAVHRAMEVLVSLLGPDDRVTLVGFAREPRLLAEQLPGNKAAQLLDIIARTPAQGGTNLEEALRLGGQLARRQFAANAQNRIVLLTDGAANLGNADPAQLAASIDALRQQGVSFDACGVGIDGINDEVLEALTRKGAGRYYVLDTPESADAGFARQLAGAFRPAAENVKVQVRFNPARVGSYRLIGFEQHRLREEDFRNDQVEAAALASGEAAVALYEVEALPQGEGELGEVYVRFRDTATGSMVERSWTMPYDPYAPSFDRATPTMQLAGIAALMAEKLRGGAAGDAIGLAQLAPVVNALRGHYAHEARVQELVAMFEQMRRLDRE